MYLKQFVQYTILGLVAFLCDLLLLQGLLATGLVWYPIAVGLSYWIASSGHYMGNRLWTFRHTKTSFWYAYISYLSVNIVSIVVLSLLVWGVVETWNIDVVLARIVCGGLVSFMAFNLQRVFAFKVGGTIKR